MRRRAAESSLLAVGVVLAVAVAVVSAACGEVRLMDPTATDVNVAGAFFEVWVHERAPAALLTFQGHVYGYEEVAGGVRIRYLEAGPVAVSGRAASRRYVRAGEPEYVLRSVTYGAPRQVSIRVVGSEAVPACSLSLAVPVVVLPDDGAAVSRGEDLVVPLPLVPGVASSEGHVTVQASFDFGGAEYPAAAYVDWRVTGLVLVLPADGLRTLPAGNAELSLEVRLEQSLVGPGAGPACAPALMTRTVYKVSRRFSLR